MIVYRPHRGSLEDAMKEVKTFDNWYQMTHYIANNWNLAIGKKVIDPDDIVMDDKPVNDDRVGWILSKPKDNGEKHQPRFVVSVKDIFFEVFFRSSASRFTSQKRMQR